MILVTGATGNVGRHLMRELRDRGVPARAFARDEQKASEVLPGDVELEVGDFADASSVTRALNGVKQVYLASNGPGQREYEGRVVETAVRAGVQRIVKLSSWVDWGTSLWDWNADCERQLRASSIPAVVLRPTFLMANLLASRDSIREQAKLFAPAEGARVAMIDPRDVAAVAATILAGGGSEEQTYLLTGPEAITYNDIAETLTAVVGRPIEFVPVSDEAAHQAFLRGGVPDWAAGALVSLFQRLREGVQDVTTDVVRRLTGREPRTVAEFLRDHAQVFQDEAPARVAP
jgi:uncharacterized protein YbjT (DUF2867 family)